MLIQQAKYVKEPVFKIYRLPLSAIFANNKWQVKNQAIILL